MLFQYNSIFIYFCSQSDARLFLACSAGWVFLGTRVTLRALDSWPRRHVGIQADRRELGKTREIGLTGNPAESQKLRSPAKGVSWKNNELRQAYIFLLQPPPPPCHSPCLSPAPLVAIFFLSPTFLLLEDPTGGETTERTSTKIRLHCRLGFSQSVVENWGLFVQVVLHLRSLYFFFD